MAKAADTITPEVPPAEPIAETASVATNVAPGNEMKAIAEEGDLVAYDQQTVVQMCDLQDKIDAMSSEYDKASALAKEKKKAWDALVDELQRVNRERRTNRGKPVQKSLLDFIPPLAPADLPAVASPPGNDLENLWREVPITRIATWGATESDLIKLQEGARNKGEPFPITTIGALASYTSNDGGTAGYERRISDFKGLGMAASTRVGDALEGFWKWYNSGGKEEFAKERGLIDGTPPVEGTGAEGPGPGDQPAETSEPDPTRYAGTPNFDDLAADHAADRAAADAAERAAEQFEPPADGPDVGFSLDPGGDSGQEEVDGATP